MWQLAILWNFVPDWIIVWLINGLIVVGLVGVSAAWIARWIPYFNLYRGPIQLVGIVCLVLGVYLKGGADVEQSWRSRVEAVQEKIRIAESQSREANIRLETQLQSNKKLTQEVKNATKANIRANAEQIDRECRVPDIAISLHNSASLNQISGGSSGTSGALPGPKTGQSSGSQSK